MIKRLNIKFVRKDQSVHDEPPGFPSVMVLAFDAKDLPLWTAPVPALLDTGSNVNGIDPEMIGRLDKLDPIQVQTASGPDTLEGRRGTVQFPGGYIRQCAMVPVSGVKVLLGLPFLNSGHLNLDYTRGEYFFDLDTRPVDLDISLLWPSSRTLQANRS